MQSIQLTTWSAACLVDIAQQKLIKREYIGISRTGSNNIYDVDNFIIILNLTPWVRNAESAATPHLSAILLLHPDLQRR